jgi:hypothetical protein
MQKYNSDSAWWNFAAVGNYAARFYSFSMAPESLVRTLQRNLEKRLEKGVVQVEEEVVALLSRSGKRRAESVAALSDASTDRVGATLGSVVSEAVEVPFDATRAAVELLTAFSCTEGDAVSAEWRDLLPRVMTTYRDGMVIGDTHKAVFTIQKMFYPRWWLEAVGYFNNEGNPHGILFSSNPAYRGRWSFSDVCLVLLAAILCVLGGFVMGKRSASAPQPPSSFFPASRARKGYVALALRTHATAASESRSRAPIGTQVQVPPHTAPQAILETYQC